MRTAHSDPAPIPALVAADEQSIVPSMSPAAVARFEQAFTSYSRSAAPVTTPGASTAERLTEEAVARRSAYAGAARAAQEAAAERAAEAEAHLFESGAEAAQYAANKRAAQDAADERAAEAEAHLMESFPDEADAHAANQPALDEARSHKWRRSSALKLFFTGSQKAFKIAAALVAFLSGLAAIWTFVVQTHW